MCSFDGKAAVTSRHRYKRDWRPFRRHVKRQDSVCTRIGNWPLRGNVPIRCVALYTWRVVDEYIGETEKNLVLVFDPVGGAIRYCYSTRRMDCLISGLTINRR